MLLVSKDSSLLNLSSEHTMNIGKRYFEFKEFINSKLKDLSKDFEQRVNDYCIQSSSDIQLSIGSLNNLLDEHNGQIQKMKKEINGFDGSISGFSPPSEKNSSGQETINDVLNNIGD
jgi:hypothetical protein